LRGYDCWGFPCGTGVEGDMKNALTTAATAAHHPVGCD